MGPKSYEEARAMRGNWKQSMRSKLKKSDASKVDIDVV